MLKYIAIRNFKGVRDVRVELGGFRLVVGGLGGGKSSVSAALCYLSMLARGAGAAVAKYGWLNDRFVSELSVSIDTPTCGEVAYTLRVRRNGIQTWIEQEELVQGDKIWLRRENRRIVLSDGCTYDVAGGLSALSSVVAVPFGSPIQDVRSCLQGIWILAPHPDEMVSEIDNSIADIDTSCRYLAQYVVARQRQQPAVYGLLLAYLRELGSDISAFSLQSNMFNRQYLVVRRAGSLFPPNGMPFECLSEGEKILVLVALLRAVNEHIAPVCCVWDNPLRDLGGREGLAVLKMLQSSFSQKGDLLILSPPNAVIGQMANVQRLGSGK